MRRSNHSGMVTAETAMVLPALLVLVAAIASVGQVMLAQVNCIDAARATTRLAIRGDVPGGLAAGHALAPAGAAISVPTQGEQVRTSVSASIRLLLPGRPSLGITCSATGVREMSLS